MLVLRADRRSAPPSRAGSTRPYHGAGFVDPTTTAIGFGFAGDTSTGLFSEGGAPQLSRWPKPDGVLPSPAMTTGESPDPQGGLRLRQPAGWAGRSS